MAALLPLHRHELPVVLWALNAFAIACEADGDRDNGHIADSVANRVRELDRLSSTDGEELVKALGLGRYASRPQG